MDTYTGPGALLDVIRGALLLRPSTYRAVAGDVAATRLSIAVVLVSGMATALSIDPVFVLPVALVLGMVVTLGILGIEATLVWAVCRLALGEPTSFGRAVRPLAIAHAPRLLYLLVPLLGLPAALRIAAAVWLLAAFVVAIEAVADRGWAVAVAVAIGVGVLRWLGNAAISGT